MTSRHCSCCGARFAPTEWDDRYCSMHCHLRDLGEPCGSPCAACDHERAATEAAAMFLMAISAHNEAVTAHIEADLDPRRN